MLSKNELAKEVEARIGVKPNLVKNILDSVAEIAQEQVAAGQDFKVPGVATIRFGYTSPLKKGEKYRKGDTYTGFGGAEVTAEADSKPRVESVRLKATPEPIIKRLMPGKGTKGYKAVVARKKK